MESPRPKTGEIHRQNVETAQFGNDHGALPIETEGSHHLRTETQQTVDNMVEQRGDSPVVIEEVSEHREISERRQSSSPDKFPRSPPKLSKTVEQGEAPFPSDRENELKKAARALELMQSMESAVSSTTKKKRKRRKRKKRPQSSKQPVKKEDDEEPKEEEKLNYEKTVPVVNTNDIKLDLEE